MKRKRQTKPHEAYDHSGNLVPVNNMDWLDKHGADKLTYLQCKTIALYKLSAHLNIRQRAADLMSVCGYDHVAVTRQHATELVSAMEKHGHRWQLIYTLDSDRVHVYRCVHCKYRWNTGVDELHVLPTCEEVIAERVAHKLIGDPNGP